MRPSLVGVIALYVASDSPGGEFSVLSGKRDDLMPARLYRSALVAVYMTGVGGDDALYRSKKVGYNDGVSLSAADEEIYGGVLFADGGAYLLPRSLAVFVLTVARRGNEVSLIKALDYPGVRPSRVVTFKVKHRLPPLFLFCGRIFRPWRGYS